MKRNVVAYSVLLIVLVGVSALPVWTVAAAQATPMPATTSEHPYLGVRLSDAPEGVVAANVIAGSPAATAGFQIGDIIQTVNNSAVVNVYQASQAIDAMNVGDKITLGVSRAGQTQNLTATLGSVPASEGQIVPNNMPFDAIGYNDTDESWSVYSLAQTGDLYSAGLRQGDIITQFDGNTYLPDQLQTFLSGFPAADVNDTVTLTVQHNGTSMDVKVAPAVLQALNIDGYEHEGLMFNIVQPAATNAPAVPSLPSHAGFNAIAYNPADQSWYAFGLEGNSALFTAGLHVGDHIMKFDGTAYTPAALQSYRQSLDDTATVTLSVQNTGNAMDVKVPASALNMLDYFNAPSGSMLFGLAETNSPVSLGAEVTTLTSDLSTQYKLAVTQGVLVLGVMQDSAAAKAGLQMNDVISAVDQTPITNTSTLLQSLSTFKPGDQVTLDIMRGSNATQVNATLGEALVSGEIPLLTPVQ